MTESTESPEIINVAEGIYVRQAVDNMSWIDLGGEAVIIDTLEHVELESEVAASIKSTIGHIPVRWILNTHTHFDHVALNSAFRKRYLAEIINGNSSSLTDDGLWLEGLNRHILMKPLESGHSDTDCLIWIPEDKVLFTGDVFGWGMIPLIRPLNRSSADILMGAYETLIAFDANVIVPGHGKLCSTAELQRFVTYFHDLVNYAHRNPEAETIDPPQDMLHWWRFTDWKHENSVQRVLRAVKSGEL